MSVRIVYQDIAAGADEDAAIETESAASFSDPSLLPFGGSEAPLASLEPGSWLLDGSRELLDEQPVAFWSTEPSGPDGLFETPPELTLSFDSRYTSPGLFLRFDPGTGDYCTSVTIQWLRGETVLAEAGFAPDGVDFFCARVVEAYDRIILRFHATSLPYRYAKLTKIVFGLSRTFLRDELRNVRITAEASVISSEIAVNTLDFTLDSKTDVEYMFQLKQPVSAYDGDRLIGVFYIDSSTHRASGLYDISCIDAIGVLDEDTVPAAIYNGYPAGQLLEEIVGGHFELKLDTALALSPISGYLPSCTRRQALQQVVFALRAVADTSGTQAIRIYRDRENTPGKFPLNRVYTGGTVETAAIVTAVRVTSHSYSLTGSGNDTVEVDGKTWYHTASVTEINNPKVVATDKQNVVEVSGATLVTPDNVAQVAQHVYTYQMKRERQKVRIVMAGELPGDRVSVPTPWGTIISGYITRMDIVLSGVAAADCEIVGTEVKAAGEPEYRLSGTFMSGEV